MSALFLLAILFVCLTVGIPVAISLGLASISTILLFADQSLLSLAQRFFHTMQIYPLLAVPFFILAATFMTTGGVAKRMIDFANALVGHSSETKHSILLPGAKAPHFNYVGDSVLGPNVNLGAGVKLSNLRNDGGEVHVRIEGERIASGLRKFGAIIGEGSQLGCNAVTNPGVVLGPRCMVMPNTTVTGIYDSDSKIG